MRIGVAFDYVDDAENQAGCIFSALKDLMPEFLVLDRDEFLNLWAFLLGYTSWFDLIATSAAETTTNKIIISPQTIDSLAMGMSLCMGITCADECVYRGILRQAATPNEALLFNGLAQPPARANGLIRQAAYKAQSLRNEFYIYENDLIEYLYRNYGTARCSRPALMNAFAEHQTARRKKADSIEVIDFQLAVPTLGEGKYAITIEAAIDRLIDTGVLGYVTEDKVFITKEWVAAVEYPLTSGYSSQWQYWVRNVAHKIGANGCRAQRYKWTDLVCLFLANSNLADAVHYASSTASPFRRGKQLAAA